MTGEPEIDEIQQKFRALLIYCTFCTAVSRFVFQSIFVSVRLITGAFSLVFAILRSGSTVVTQPDDKTNGSDSLVSGLAVFYVCFS